MNALSRCRPGTGSRCVVCRMATCKSPKTVTLVTLCACNAFAIANDFPSATQVANSSESNTCIRPMPRKLRNTVQMSPCKHNAASQTFPLSVRDPSVHHIHGPDPALIFILLAHRSEPLIAMASSSSIYVLTAGFTPGSGQHSVSALRPGVCSIVATGPTAAPGVV